MGINQGRFRGQLYMFAGSAIRTKAIVIGIVNRIDSLQKEKTGILTFKFITANF